MNANTVARRLVINLPIPMYSSYLHIKIMTDIIDLEYKPLHAQLDIAKKALEKVQALGGVSMIHAAEAIGEIDNIQNRGISEKHETSWKSEPARILDL